MKKLLFIVLLNFCLADNNQGIFNNTVAYVAAKCFPSGNFANAIGFNGSFYCPDTDRVMYFFRFSANSQQTEDYLDSISTVTTDFQNYSDSSYTDFHSLGVWKLVFSGKNQADQCAIDGLASATINCLITCAGAQVC